jgi:hypothetical protein
VHHEPPSQQHGRDGENGEHRLDGHHHGDHDAQVDLGKVGFQGLGVEYQVLHLHGAVGHPHRADQEDMVPEPAQDLAACDGRRPGERMPAGAEGASGQRDGNGVEYE